MKSSRKPRPTENTNAKKTKKQKRPKRQRPSVSIFRRRKGVCDGEGATEDKHNVKIGLPLGISKQGCETGAEPWELRGACTALSKETVMAEDSKRPGVHRARCTRFRLGRGAFRPERPATLHASTYAVS